MKILFSKTIILIKRIFSTTPNNLMQYLIILIVGFLFIWMPQRLPNDWELNTKGFWSFFPQTYISNQNFVYPPWGLILLLPYYFIHATGARVLSVLSIGWLTHLRRWPLSYFFVIVLSPYFLVTMTVSNMDILVIVFPILLWECSRGKRLENVYRGISLSILLLKPQCTILMLAYLVLTYHKEWEKVLLQLGIVALLIVPISLFGSPILFFQWLNNIINPSSQNLSFWSVNNISLTSEFGFLIALGILFLAIFILNLLFITGIFSWKIDHTITSLLLGSMYLTPYTSQQSFSSGLAFIPSWPGFLVQWLIVGLGLVKFQFLHNIPIFSFIIAFISLLFYSLPTNKQENNGLLIDDVLPPIL